MSQSGPTRPSTASAERRGASMYAIPGVIFFVLIVALVVFLLTRGGDDSSSTTDAAGIQTQLKTAAPLLRGTGDADALAAASCTAATEAGQFDCVPQGAAAKQVVRIVADGNRLSKRLAGEQPAEAPRAGQAVATALRLDATARGIDVPRYACATTARVAPGGGAESGGANGFLCYAADVVRSAADGTGDSAAPAALAARYVEFGDGGTVVRDYAVTPR